MGLTAFSREENKDSGQVPSGRSSGRSKAQEQGRNKTGGRQASAEELNMPQSFTGLRAEQASAEELNRPQRGEGQGGQVPSGSLQ